VVDNLNFAIEDVARTVRFGSYFYCGISSNLSAVNDCSTGGSAVSVTFKGSGCGGPGCRVIYKWNGTIADPIEMSTDGGMNYTDITAPEVKIEYLKFYVFGGDNTDVVQPYVLVVMKGYVGSKPTTKSTFSIETLMSQRTLDI
jgi:hypothetical protein